MTMSTTAPVAQRTNVYAEAEMLAHAQPVQVLNLFGDSHPLPKNKGSILQMRRWDVKTLSVDSNGDPVALTEGVDPGGADITYSNEEVTLKQYGDYVKITDRCEDEYEDPVRQHATEQNGEQAGEVIELACWGALRGGSNVEYSNGTGRGDVNTAVNDALIQRIERSLMAEKGKHIRKVQTGSKNYATTTVPASYVIIGHTDLLKDFQALTGWKPYDSYASQDRICDYEEGTVGKFRVILSPTLTNWPDEGGLKGTMVSTTGTDADVYPFIAFADHAYGHTRLKGKGAIQPMIVQPDTASAGDRLGQMGSVGWKAKYVAGITAEFWIIRGEVAATAV